MARWRSAWLGLVAACMLMAAGLSGAQQLGEPVQVTCGPLRAPEEAMCAMGAHHAAFTGYSYVLYYGFNFTGSVTITLAYGPLWHSATCEAVNGFPVGDCTRKGLEPRRGMPIEARCSAAGEGVWGCQIEYR